MAERKDLPQGTLELILHEAKELRNVQMIGKQDPYCVVQLGKIKVKTRVHDDGGKGAKWEDTLRIPLRGQEDEVILRFFVMDKNTLSDTEIGRAELQVRDVIARQEARKWLQISHNNKLAGQICFTARWWPALIFEIQEGKNLHDVNLITKQDPYVQIKVLHARGEPTKKTAVVKDGHKNPKFTKDNKLTFAKPVQPERSEKDGSEVEPAFEIEVRNEDTIGSSLIGKFTLTWSQAWNASNGVPQWYTLYRGEDNSKVAGQLLVAISKWR